MPTQKKTANQTSAVSPQYSTSLRKIILLERISKARNDEYEKKLSAYMENCKSKMANLSEKEIKGLEQSFTRRFYKYEYNAIAEHSGMKEELQSIKEKQNDPASLNLNKTEKERLVKLEYLTKMEPAEYAASKLFDDGVIKSLKKEYPSVNRQITAEIKGIAKTEFPELSPQKATRPATVALFNKSYPNLKTELNDIAKIPGKSEFGRAGLAMLKVQAALLNPSSLLVSKGIGAVLSTRTFKPFVNEVSRGIKNVAEKTGLSSKIKASIGSLSGDSFKRVALGVAAAAGTGLFVLGVADPEMVSDVYTSISAAIGDFATASASDLSAQSSSAIDFDNALFGNEISPINGDVPTTEADLLYYELVGEVNENAPLVSAIDIPVADMPVANIPAESLDVIDSSVLPSPVDTTTSPVQVGDVLPADTSAPIVDSISEAKKLAGVGSDALSDAPQQDLFILESTSYNVVSGDTLSEIVEERLKEAGKPYNYSMIEEHVKEIAALNNISNPDLIQITEIELPSLPMNAPLITDASIAQGLDNVTGYLPEHNTPRVISEISPTGGFDTDPAFARIEMASNYLAPPTVVNGNELSHTYSKMSR